MLVLLVVGQECLSLLIGIQRQRAAEWVTHTLIVEREGENLLSAALEEQTSLGGYLLTKDKAYLETYRTGQTAFRSSLSRLYTLVQDNPAQLKQLDRIREVHNHWQSQYAQGVLSGSVNRPTLAGKTLFDSLGNQVRTLQQHEEILLGERNQRLHQLYQLNTALDILTTVAIALGVSFNIWLLHRRVEVPLRQLTEVGEAWRADRMEVRLDYASADEIGRLAEVLDAMASQIRERQERSKARNQQLEDLICALSHDLRTPLFATRTTLNSMLKGAFGSVSDTWRDVLEEFRQANEDLLKLVEALLDVSRYEAGYGERLNWEPLNWEKIFVQTTARNGATSKRECAISYNIPRALPTVKGDELEIQRVVQNLLDNAVRVSDKIILELVTLGAAQMQVSVRDNGPGISPQEKERLFHRFIQGRARRGGAGLGLYLCRQIVEAHGGTIGVESTLGEGSTFWFTLPIATNKAEP